MQTRVVKVWYRDHHSERLDPESGIEASECQNWDIGEIVYEDDGWIRLCHEKTNITMGNEDWGVITISKADIIRIESGVLS